MLPMQSKRARNFSLHDAECSVVQSFVHDL
jgi:hypothetical protein